jgi:hypothetical protein
MKPEDDEGAVRITQQFRSRDAMIYDLRSSAGRLTLRISGRSGDEGPATVWRIEAGTSSAPDAVVVTESAATRTEALRAVARSWNEKRLSSSLPQFDWESVVAAMTAVRAL